MHLLTKKTLGLVLLISLAIVWTVEADDENYKYCDEQKDQDERMDLFREKICYNNIVEQKAWKRRCKPKRSKLFARERKEGKTAS